MERRDSACDGPQASCGYLRVFFIFCEGDSQDWVHTVDDRAKDGEGHILGQVRTQLCQKFFFLKASAVILPPLRDRLARIAASACMMSSS